MMVRNVHERIINTRVQEVGSLIDGLGSRDDALWPRDRWPPIKFDRPLAVGASGGHGPIRYVVEVYEPGRRIRFRFLAPRGFDGTHELNLEEIDAERVRLRHTLLMRARGAARISWPLVFRPLHDALIEDALDCAENVCTSSLSAKRREWTWHVRALRCLMIFLKARSDYRSLQAARRTEPRS